jgi:hypothetical protein
MTKPLIDANLGLAAGVTSMEGSMAVIVVVHRDDNPMEATDRRHVA